MRFGTSWKRFRLRLRYLARHSERERLLWEEMDFHIESMAQELIGRGMSEQEARAAAHRKFGNRGHLTKRKFMYVKARRTRFWVFGGVGTHL